jgi:putative FmdB family regulatory protein
MPIYEFHCLNCGVVFDLRRSIAQMNDAAPCKQCHSSKAERQVASGVNFLGRSPEATHNESSTRTTGAMLRLEGKGSGTLIGNKFIGGGTGLSVGGEQRVRGDLLSFSGNTTAIETTDSADLQLGRVAID